MRLQNFRDVEIALSKIPKVEVRTVETIKETVKEVATSNQIDSFQQGGVVVHKLVHKFLGDLQTTDIVPVTTDISVIGTTLLRYKEIYLKYWDINQNLLPKTDNTVDIGSSTKTIKLIYTQGGYVLGETASKPLHLDSNKKMVSKAVALASDVSGQLGVANGGTGASTLTSGSVLVGNGTGAVSLVAGVSSSYAYVGSVGGTPVTINYKDHSGANQSVTVIQTLTGTSGALYFTNGVLTSAT